MKNFTSFTPVPLKLTGCAFHSVMYTQKPSLQIVYSITKAKIQTWMHKGQERKSCNCPFSPNSRWSVLQIDSFFFTDLFGFYLNKKKPTKQDKKVSVFFFSPSIGGFCCSVHKFVQQPPPPPLYIHVHVCYM